MKALKFLFAIIIISQVSSCARYETPKNDIAMSEPKAKTATVSSLPEIDALEAY